MLDKNTYGMGSKELSAIKKSMVNLVTNGEIRTIKITCI